MVVQLDELLGIEIVASLFELRDGVGGNAVIVHANQIVG